jgi:hypothetical protein
MYTDWEAEILVSSCPTPSPNSEKTLRGTLKIRKSKPDVGAIAMNSTGKALKKMLFPFLTKRMAALRLYSKTWKAVIKQSSSLNLILEK